MAMVAASVAAAALMGSGAAPLLAANPVASTTPQRVLRAGPMLGYSQMREVAIWVQTESAADVQIAIASCLYVNEPEHDRPGEPYGAEFQIIDHLRAQAPEAMVWLGDNVYLRETDWHSRSGILHRYSHTRAYPGLQPLLASTHNYATWDDHDFGPNDSDRGYWAKHLTLEAFKLFWPNPGYGTPEFDGVASTFEWSDALFVMLDNRYHRAPNDRTTGKRTMFGQAQLEWLIDVLASSDAPFKFVVSGGQILNPFDGFETHTTYPEEHAWLLETLAAERIPGVIFLTGDRHRTELTRLDRPGTYPLYDLTISPLTAGPYTNEPEPNDLVVDGTVVQARNFALLKVAGPRRDRVLTIAVVDKDGVERWSRQISARDLRPAR